MYILVRNRQKLNLITVLSLWHWDEDLSGGLCTNQLKALDKLNHTAMCKFQFSKCSLNYMYIYIYNLYMVFKYRRNTVSLNASVRSCNVRVKMRSNVVLSELFMNAIRKNKPSVMRIISAYTRTGEWKTHDGITVRGFTLCSVQCWEIKLVESINIEQDKTCAAV